MHKDNWDGFESYYRKKVQPERMALQSTLESVISRRRAKALIPLMIALASFVLWLMKYKLQIDFLSGIEDIGQGHYWLAIIAGGAMGAYFLTAKSEERQGDARLMALIAAYRGWQYHFLPGKALTLKPFDEEGHLFKALLAGKIGYQLSAEESLDTVRVEVNHRVEMPPVELISVKCEVDFTRYIGDEIQQSGKNCYFDGIFMKLPLPPGSGRRFAVCPRDAFAAMNSLSEDQLSAAVNLPVDIRRSPVTAPYVVFSRDEDERIDRLMEIIVDSGQQVLPLHRTLVYCDGECLFVAFDYRASVFALDLHDMDEDIDLFKNRLDYFFNCSIQLKSVFL